MKKKIILLFLLCFSLYSQSQNSEYIKGFLQKNIAPLPTVNEFSKFVNTPLNYSPGALNIALPIYTIQSGNISIPISIVHSSNGEQINALSGIIGTN